MRKVKTIAMEAKTYLDPREYLRDCWRLARKVYDSGWRPDVLLVLWRGGAAPGVALHEFFKAKGVSLRHEPVKCSSYTGIGTSNAVVEFDERAESLIKSLESGTKVLVVDDVFDTGRTAAAVHGRMDAIGCEMRLACVYWKPSKNVTEYLPDYFVAQTDDWIVFPHEIEGLAPDEVAQKDPVLAELLFG